MAIASFLVVIFVAIPVVVVIALLAALVIKHYGLTGWIVNIACVLLTLIAFAVIFVADVEKPIVVAQSVNSDSRPTPTVMVPQGTPVPQGLPVPPASPTSPPPAVPQGLVDASSAPPSSPPGVRVTARPDAAVASWLSSEMEAFDASLYPGLIRCATPLAKSVAGAMAENQLLPKPKGDDKATSIPLEVRNSARSDAQELAFLTQFVTELQKQFPDTAIQQTGNGFSEEQATDPDPSQVVLSVFVTYDQEQSVFGTSGKKATVSGEVICQVSAASGSADSRLKFVEKPWVYDFDQLVSQSPGKRYVVGYSQELASSEFEARESAMRNARSQIQITTNRGQRLEIDESDVVDRFAQKLSRPYGDVWREAVLVDVTDEALRADVARVVASANRSDQVRAATAMGTFLLLGCTVVFCFVANALTEGYYRRKIRLGAGAITAIAILAGIFLLGTMA